jgi:hypothetical protein
VRVAWRDAVRSRPLVYWVGVTAAAILCVTFAALGGWVMAFIFFAIVFAGTSAVMYPKR